MKTLLTHLDGIIIAVFTIQLFVAAIGLYIADSGPKKQKQK